MSHGAFQLLRNTNRALVNIVPVIRSCAGGSDEVRRGLCYDQHHVWKVTVVVTLPDTLPCVLRGRSGTDGQGQFLPRVLSPSPAILDIATYLSLNTL